MSTGLHALSGLKNIYFDTAVVCESPCLEAIINEFGHERLLYATLGSVCFYFCFVRPSLFNFNLFLPFITRVCNSGTGETLYFNRRHCFSLM
jgi:hypothetical protein